MIKAISKQRFKELHKKYGTTKSEDTDVGVVPFNKQPKSVVKHQHRSMK